MDKRGQLTLFLIIAVVIVGAVIVIYSLSYVKTPNPENPQYGSLDVTEINNYIDSCLKDTSKESLILLGKQGGYYILPEKTTTVFTYRYPLFLDKTESLVPPNQIIQEQLNAFINNSMVICLDNFTEFKQVGFIINQDPMEVNSQINSDNVIIDVNMSLTIKKGDSTAQISKFSTKVNPLMLPKIMDFASQLSTQQKDNPKTICLTCISTLANQYNLDVKITETDDRNIFVYKITDSESNFTGSPYEFKFASSYDFPDCNTTGECFNELSK